jgi:hypothetical protein
MFLFLKDNSSLISMFVTELSFLLSSMGSFLCPLWDLFLLNNTTTQKSTSRFGVRDLVGLTPYFILNVVVSVKIPTNNFLLSNTEEPHAFVL